MSLSKSSGIKRKASVLLEPEAQRNMSWNIYIQNDDALLLLGGNYIARWGWMILVRFSHLRSMAPSDKGLVREPLLFFCEYFSLLDSWISMSEAASDFDLPFPE